MRRTPPRAPNTTALRGTTAPAFVAYLRVSTKRQGESGLGLDGQRAQIAAHVARQGGRLLAEHVEIESGRRNDRPELARALDAAKAAGATLVIAKLDRLARNVAFITALMESGQEFVTLDFPGVNRLTLHVLAAVAEDEARRTSERTVAALQAAKARGVKLGNPKNLTVQARLRGAATNRERARRATGPIVSVIKRLREQDRCSLRQIAAWLNANGWKRAGDHPWHASQVARALMREGKAA